MRRMFVLHAVTRDLPGDLDTDGLLRYDGHGLTVLHERTDDRPELTREAVVEQGRRVTRLAQRCSLLPMRYDTAVETFAELEALLEEHADEWTERLDVLAGQCELIVHVDERDVGRPAPDTVSGREYLLDRVASQRRRTELLASAAAEIGRWSRDQRTLPDDRRIAALVPFASVDAVRDGVCAWAARQAGVEVTVTGPWPPFSFCSTEAPA